MKTRSTAKQSTSAVSKQRSKTVEQVSASARATAQNAARSLELTQQIATRTIKIIPTTLLTLNANNPRTLSFDPAALKALAVEVNITKESICDSERLSDSLEAARSIIGANARFEEFQHIAELASSIAKQGQLQPARGYATDAGEYCIVSGNRRALACSMINEPLEIELVSQGSALSDSLNALIENINREDLSFKDTYKAVLHILDLSGIARDSVTFHDLTRLFSWTAKSTLSRWKNAIAAGSALERAIESDLVTSLNGTEQFLKGQGRAAPASPEPAPAETPNTKAVFEVKGAKKHLDAHRRVAEMVLTSLFNTEAKALINERFNQLDTKSDIMAAFAHIYDHLLRDGV